MGSQRLPNIKIISSPNSLSWSQAYTAGKLAALLCITKSEDTQDNEETHLPTIGKQLIANLEAEYFTLETKSLFSIKQALTHALLDIPSSLSVTFLVTTVVDDILYAFAKGAGQISMYREGKLGTILLPHDTDTLVSASGKLSHADTICLVTDAFLSLIPQATLTNYLSLPLTDMHEQCMLEIHKEKNPLAAGLLFSFLTDNTSVPVSTPQVPETTQEPETPLSLSIHKKRFLPSFPSFSFHITHKKKLLATIALILVGIFTLSIIFSLQKKHTEKANSAYSLYVVPAKQKYDEGISLLDLNKTLARENLLQAQTLLTKATGKFPDHSSQETSFNELKQQIDQALSQFSDTTSSVATKADSKESPMLNALQSNPSVLLATQDGTDIYVLEKNQIGKLTSGAISPVVKNTSLWTHPLAFAAYGGNFYILESDSFVKLVPSESGYTKTNYFASSPPHLSSYISFAIDSSIWFLTKEGSIEKFTKGTQDPFTSPSLSAQHSLFLTTSPDLSLVYILDSKAKRITAISKSGEIQKQYTTPSLSSATLLDVHESEKLLYFLAGNTVYKLDL